MTARDILNLRCGVFAHRGDSSTYPENTLPAFRSAFEMGCPMVETDLHMSRDGQLVLWHDERTGRNTDRDLRLADTTLAELRGLDAGYLFSAADGSTPFRGMGLYLMTLDELLEEFPGQVFNIDLKSRNSEIATRYAETLARHRAWQRTITGSFHDRVLRRFRSLAGECITSMGPAEVRRAVLTEKLPFGLISRLQSLLHRGSRGGKLFQVPEKYGAFESRRPEAHPDLEQSRYSGPGMDRQ